MGVDSGPKRTFIAAAELSILSPELLREKHRRLVTDHFGRAAGNGLRVLEDLYTHPFIDTSTVREKLGLSFPAAAELIDRFVEAELLAEITGRERYRVWQYFPYVRLFSDVG